MLERPSPPSLRDGSPSPASKRGRGKASHRLREIRSRRAILLHGASLANRLFCLASLSRSFVRVHAMHTSGADSPPEAVWEHPPPDRRCTALLGAFRTLSLGGRPLPQEKGGHREISHRETGPATPGRAAEIGQSAGRCDRHEWRFGDISKDPAAPKVAIAPLLRSPLHWPVVPWRTGCERWPPIILL